MSLLNWSLKFHIRLRTISHLISTHITHDYVQWMPYSFMWLYLIKCVVHTQSYVDQTQKDFWVFLFVFGKFFFFFFFFKLQKIKKFYNSVFGNSLASQASCKAPVTSLLRRFRDSLASEYPSREKHLEKFSKFLGFGHFPDFVTSGSSNRKLT